MLWLITCLYTTCGLVCLLHVVLFSCCDARDKRYRGGIWKGFIGERWEFISLINEEKFRNIMLKSGKLSSELAFIYIYFGSHVLLIKSISDLCGVCHKRYDFENPFPKYKYIILTPYMEILAGISFPNYRMGKYCLLKTPLKVRGWMWNAVISVLKWRNGDGCEKKCTLCPCTYRTTNNLCDHIYPHMGTGLSHIICSY